MAALAIGFIVVYGVIGLAWALHASYISIRRDPL